MAPLCMLQSWEAFVTLWYDMQRAFKLFWLQTNVYVELSVALFPFIDCSMLTSKGGNEKEGWWSFGYAFRRFIRIKANGIHFLKQRHYFMEATMACQFNWKAIIWRLMSSRESHFLEQVSRCENTLGDTQFTHIYQPLSVIKMIIRAQSLYFLG